jgi:hypothetical protein
MGIFDLPGHILQIPASVIKDAVGKPSENGNTNTGDNIKDAVFDIIDPFDMMKKTF